MPNRSTRVRRQLRRSAPRPNHSTRRWQWKKVTNAVILLLEVTAKAVNVYRAWKGL